MVVFGSALLFPAQQWVMPKFAGRLLCWGWGCVACANHRHCLGHCSFDQVADFMHDDAFAQFLYVHVQACYALFQISCAFNSHCPEGCPRPGMGKTGFMHNMGSFLIGGQCPLALDLVGLASKTYKRALQDIMTMTLPRPSNLRSARFDNQSILVATFKGFEFVLGNAL